MKEDKVIVIQLVKPLGILYRPFCLLLVTVGPVVAPPKRGGSKLEEFEMSGLPNIVLVHGAWADGSSWNGVIERLQRDGFKVTAPQFPMGKLSDDVARLREVLARQDGPT